MQFLRRAVDNFKSFLPVATKPTSSQSPFFSMSGSFKHRLAILDDYQHVAFECADWTGVEPRLDITVFDNTIQASTDTEALIQRLEPFDVICSMRERTKFPADIIKRLPNLKLLTTTAMGNRSIDIKAAQDEGILVAGTGYVGVGTAEHKYVRAFCNTDPSHGDPTRTPTLVGCLSWLLLGASSMTIIIPRMATRCGKPGYRWN